MKVSKLLLLATFCLLFATFSVGKANAAVKTWNPAGCASTSWNTGGNWTGGLPGTADIATFDGATSNCNVTVDTSVDIAGINITGSYTGTITQGNGNDINIRASGYVQNAASSTFSGGDSTSDITFTSAGGDFTLTTGVFNTPAGTITAGDDWTISGGTFTASSGTVAWSGSTDQDQVITGTSTYYNLTLDDICTNGTTYTLSGTLTVNNTLTLSHGCNSTSNLDGGSISAKGDVNIENDGIVGSTVVTVNGTGTQTITGDNGGDGFAPAFAINKSTGTTNFVGTINFTDDWTLTQGSTDFGTSLINFAGGQDGTVTVTGSATFYDLKFDDGCSNGTDTTIASGTTLTSTGTLYFGHGCNNTYEILGSGIIVAKGNIDTSGEGAEGVSQILINGTGNQSITGDGTTAWLPGVSINKPSGTVTFVGSFTITDDFTYTSGTVDAGTSTVAIRSYADGTASLTGSTQFYNLEFGNECTNAFTLTIASGTVVTVKNDFITYNSCGFKGYVNGPGTINAEGDLSIQNQGAFGDVAINVTGGKEQTFSTSNGTDFYTGTFTLNKSAGTLTLASQLPLVASGQDLIISSGVLNTSSYNVTVDDTMTLSSQLNQGTGTVNVGTVSIGSKGIWMNNSTGDITLGAGGLANAGLLQFDGSAYGCGEGTNSIAITSSSGGVARSWTGAGTFRLFDVNVTDQNGTITAYSSTLGSNSNWTFASGCPAYANRSTSTVGQGTRITGGTTLRSN